MRETESIKGSNIMWSKTIENKKKYKKLSINLKILLFITRLI